jgi:cytochrome c
MFSIRGRIFIAGLGLALSISLAAHGQSEAPNPARGRILFLRCASCHDISDQVSMKIGPNLKGVVGRVAGSQPGFAYSAAMKSKSITWTPAMLDRWLTKPDAVVPGTIMAFEGMPNEADRKALIAFLATPPR